MTNEQLLEKIHLVVEKLMNLGGYDYDKDKSVSSTDTKKGLIQRDFGIEEWDWPQGVGLYGLYKLQEFYGDTRYLPFFKRWYSGHQNKGLPSKNINTTAPFLPLSFLYEGLDNPEEFYDLCVKRANWLISDLPKTPDNGFQHVTSAIGDRDGVSLNNGQIWVDTLFMSVLFLNRMGYISENALLKDEALHQFLVHIKYLFDKQTGLFHHGFSFERMDNFGGIFWCRGNSWFTYGIMEYLDTCGDGLDKGVKAFLIDTFKSQASALLHLQSPSGLWNTVLTDDLSYGEVSGSAAITAGLLRGVKAGILDGSYKAAADRAIEAICANISDDGTVLNVSAGTGIGMDSDHYKNIAIMPMAYGQALALTALCEALEKE
ncbi:glycoside hydrolase family 88/105 protein [Lacrimispora sphenoides]|uniref:Unsaturated rhamnogalacturonyl hydrolase n=1 Tax=Lacrimispora sphenoides JCM 1415 TaxID=1297793 RepID=A0ABY1CJU8_9FIRM|nr:glycoside hydrolase family 88 protein [Lacrimispora sphenoides]SEU08132.1 unsaturated rhamnogalacturonyl hydrolase [[Clostridium] sphenoides JCM 1415]SUY49317.1 glycosyl hydrolase family protein [Lacrimispora sphenoides]